MGIKTGTPEHVKDEVVYDFDIYHHKTFGNTLHDSLAHLHEEASDVLYTPRNGGHWMITRYDQIAEVVQDPESFSVREQQIPRVEHSPTFIPLSLDPPECVPYRQALMPVFSPKAVRSMEDKIRSWAEKVVDDVASKNSCDFVHEVSELFPVSIFIELMGLDPSRLREFRALAEQFFSDMEEEEAFQRISAQIIGILVECIEEKRLKPDEGLISRLLSADIGGRKLTQDEMQNMCFLIFLGGLHTVTNVLSFSYWQLASMPSLQQRLVNQPERINDFVEESIRMFGVINTPRIVAKDCERFGVTFKEGDMVLCMLPMAGRDDRVNDDPATFNIDREKKPYLTFSKGPHLCLGHVLARAEIRILTEEWLKRIPSFRIKEGATQNYTTGTAFGLVDMPLEWQAQ